MQDHTYPEEHQENTTERVLKIVYPAQCECGHLFLEKYQFADVTKNGDIGFCWCGFCRTKRMVKGI
jgi:predicted SprT family Zn-dependent metalloprotease